ncbi:MAG TPA: GNAT family N-acetyltransferase [Actinomycetota bacterium]|nr:GNAT family N-acetyltransferase [Actinomycetota bacterium]
MTVSVAIRGASEPFEDEWDALADRTSASPFVRPGWINAWRDSFGRGDPLHVVASRGQEIVGVLPLERRKGSVESPTNWHTPEFGPVAVDDEVAQGMTEKLFSLGARRRSLGFVDRSHSLASRWESHARSARFRPLVRVLQQSPYVDTSVSWESYEQTLGKKLRTEIRRRRRRLEERGRLRVEVHSSGERLDVLLDEGFRVEEAAWKGSEGTAINSDRATRDFYFAVAHWGAAQGWLRLAFLRLDDSNLAFDLSLETADAHYLLKTGYDPAFRKFAPGMLMRYEMLKSAFDGGLSSYEFLGSNNPWKLEWTDQLRERMLLQAFAPSLAGRLDWAAYAHARPRAKRLLESIRRRG